jgi:thiol-disulfide isomerase/thioredoxin
LTIIDFVKNKISNIKSIDIREQFSSMLIRQMKESNPNLDDDYKRIMSLLLTDRMKEKLTQRHKTAKESTSGAQAIDFNYENFNGGRTTLKDLSGKLLYIDVWATWCGPCIKEMPALKELVAHYAGKEIEFVSISIDHQSDYKKWRKMVPEKNVGGIHLYDNEGLNSSFMKAFSVGLIPRFMMIDREGKIITAHAPRPSDKGVKGFINKQLSGPKVMKFTSN